MKKIFAFLLVAAMLVSMFAVTSFAADVSFTVNNVNTPVEDSQVVICTSLNDWANSNPNWSNNLQLTPDGDGYKVVWQSSCPAEKIKGDPDADKLIDASGFSANDGDIYVILHAGASNADAYAVGYGMTAKISKIEAGATITFSGTKSEPPVVKKVRVSNNVAKGKSYTTSLIYTQNDKWEYDANGTAPYPDTNNSELTDGYVVDNDAYGNGGWVGLHGKTPDIKPIDEGGLGGAWVVVDLGKSTDISETILYLPVAEGVAYNEVGIGMPYFVQVSVSDDGETWTDIAWLEEADIKNQSGNFSDYVSAVSVKAEGTGRYVRAVFTNGGWAFISEIAVIEAAAEEDNTSSEEDNTSSEEDTSSEEESSEEPVIPDAPTLDLDPGTPNENPSFVADITVPESYKAGEEVVVTITINDITAPNGLHTVALDLLYDNTKLTIVPMEEGSAAVDAMKEFAEWEDMTKFEVVEDTTLVRVGAGTAGTAAGKFTPAKENGQLVFNVKFIAAKDATGGAAVCVPHASVVGEYIDGDSGEILQYAGNGDEAVINAYKEPTPDKEEPSTKDEDKTPATGDATAIIFFAIIALVAMAGSAVVVKTRK